MKIEMIFALLFGGYHAAQVVEQGLIVTAFTFVSFTICGATLAYFLSLIIKKL